MKSALTDGGIGSFGHLLIVGDVVFRLPKFRKLLKITGIALAVLIGIPLIVGQVLRLIAPVVPPPGEMVDVGGYRLHIKCVSPQGKSDENLPTVVFEAGAGVSTPLSYWIQNGVSETTRICIYDRAGLGWSEESGLPRDAKTVNTALHTLLDKAEVKRPFVFAGHSIAGLYMRDYVERYPSEVAGLVFLDPSHPEQNEKLGLTKEKKDELMSKVGWIVTLVKVLKGLGILEVYNPLVSSASLEELPQDIRDQTIYLSKKTSILNTTVLEANDFDKAAEQAAKNKTLGDRPIVVISATKETTPAYLPEGISAEQLRENFANLHKKIAALSTRSEYVQIDTADHMGLVTNKENVEKIVPYILKVVRESATAKGVESDHLEKKP